MALPKIETALTQLLGIDYPIIKAPMFLVTNDKMMISAMNSGVAACIPAHNFRTDREYRAAIKSIKAQTNKGALGINLIVNKSNIRYHEQLKTTVEMGVDFVITSLGNPKKVIEHCHQNGIKVFCDVTDINYSKKVEDLGADALIAVNSVAGGHCGKTPPEVLIPELVENCSIPVISAGGVGNGKQLKDKLDLGACGVSIGSPFIATEESDVSQEYKQACVDYGAEDIVLTTKISGTPCTVINTPYVQKIGTKQSWLESFLNKNKRIKKFTKMLTFYKGMKALEKAAFSATYKTVWCAGPTIEHVKAIEPVGQIVERLVQEYHAEIEAEVTA